MVNAVDSTTEDAGAGRFDGLGPGMLVRYRGRQLIVERTLHFKSAAQEWAEHRLADDRLGRSLWFEVQETPGLVLTMYERLPAGEDPPGRDELTRDGVTYRLAERGAATYRSAERAGPAKRGKMEYVEYHAGPARLAYERFDAGPWEVSLGRLVEPAEVEMG